MDVHTGNRRTKLRSHCMMPFPPSISSWMVFGSSDENDETQSPDKLRTNDLTSTL